VPIHRKAFRKLRSRRQALIRDQHALLDLLREGLANLAPKTYAGFVHRAFTECHSLSKESIRLDSIRQSSLRPGPRLVFMIPLVTAIVSCLAARHCYKLYYIAD
jgi:hypothetical protein